MDATCSLGHSAEFDMNNARPEELRLLSAGAVQPGLIKVIDSFTRATARRVRVMFATAPEISKRVAAAGFDVVIAPPAVIDAWIRDEKAAGTDRITVGRV